MQQDLPCWRGIFNLEKLIHPINSINNSDYRGTYKVQNKLLCDKNEYMEDCHIKWTKNYGNHVDGEEDGSGEDE